MKEMGLVMQLFGDSSKFKEQTCSDLRVFIREGVGGRGSLLHGVISFSPHTLYNSNYYLLMHSMV